MMANKPKFLIEAERELKKIWDIFRDKDVLRIKLRLTLYRDDLSEPKTFVTQSVRSADSSWETCTPKYRDRDVSQSHDTLTATLESIALQVREYIEKNELVAEWDLWESSISEALKTGLTVEDLEYQSRAPILARDLNSYKAHFYSPAMAVAYAKTGAQALAENDLDRASHCAEQGLLWSNPALLMLNANGRFSGRASTGAHGKDLLREPVKDKVAELLVILAPGEGWATKSDAIDAVVKKLISSHSSFVEGCLLQPHALPQTILRWVKKDPERFSYRIRSKC